jgi:hypothetical protein
MTMRLARGAQGWDRDGNLAIFTHAHSRHSSAGVRSPLASGERARARTATRIGQRGESGVCRGCQGCVVYHRDLTGETRCKPTLIYLPPTYLA